jgi:hypothetical protein
MQPAPYRLTVSVRRYGHVVRFIADINARGIRMNNL